MSQTLLTDTAANNRKLTKLMNQIDADIRLGCFVYSEYFPESKNATKFVKEDIQSRRKKKSSWEPTKSLQGITSISFEDFDHEWFAENEVR